MNSFSGALIAPNAGLHIPKEDNFFEFLIGGWDLDWFYNKGTDIERKVKGEWIFSWIIDGQAIQDVFICPSRAERKINPKADITTGTTLRIYNPNKKAWDIHYFCNGYSTNLEARKSGTKIVLTCKEPSKYKMKWIFSDIKEKSFHWQSIISSDNGKTWILQGELFATKRA